MGADKLVGKSETPATNDISYAGSIRDEQTVG